MACVNPACPTLRDLDRLPFVGAPAKNGHFVEGTPPQGNLSPRGAAFGNVAAEVTDEDEEAIIG